VRVPGPRGAQLANGGSMAARVSSAPHVNNRNHVIRTTILLQDTVMLVCVTRCITVQTPVSCVVSQLCGSTVLILVPHFLITLTPNLMPTSCFINITTVYYQHHHHHHHRQQRQFFVACVISICAVNTLLTLRRLMSYIYGAPILDVSRSHTTTQHSR